MGRLLTASLIVIVVVLLFHFAGLLADSPSATGFVLTQLTDPANFGSGLFWTTVLGIGVGTFLVGAAIGAFITRSFELTMLIALKAPLVATLLSIGWDFILIFEQLSQINVVIATIICSPLLYGYAMTMIDWIGGKD